MGNNPVNKNFASIGRNIGLTESLAITTSETTTGKLPFAQCAGGMIFVPVGSSITTLTFYASKFADGSGAPLALYDAGSAVTLTVAAGQCYSIPDACFGAACLHLKGDQAGTVDVVAKG